jgi:hypothetical protein
MKIREEDRIANSLRKHEKAQAKKATSMRKFLKTRIAYLLDVQFFVGHDEYEIIN